MMFFRPMMAALTIPILSYLAAPALGEPGPAVIDLQSLSDEFATYASPDMARFAINKAIPSGTGLDKAQALLKQAGAYCRDDRKTGRPACGALIPVIGGDGSIQPVRWNFDFIAESGHIVTIDVNLS